MVFIRCLETRTYCDTSKPPQHLKQISSLTEEPTTSQISTCFTSLAQSTHRRFSCCPPLSTLYFIKSQGKSFGMGLRSNVAEAPNPCLNRPANQSA